MQKIKLHFPINTKRVKRKKFTHVIPINHGRFFCDKYLFKILILVKINVDGMQNTIELMV